ncbi:SPOR domain-containing protein [Micrococcus sp. 2A]|uniref:SPOR domain-containing protein n=1 Tax=Micrococcus sp. 2A TaxID=3142261 RepID=UPI00260DAA3D|nr:SPOR domain-containing protein [uncultured Micrococcus sp.]
MNDDVSTAREYYFNVRTHEVEEGAQSNWKELLGPYASHAEAESALARVQARNEAFDEAEDHDEKWNANPLDDAS